MRRTLRYSVLPAVATLLAVLAGCGGGSGEPSSQPSSTLAPGTVNRSLAGTTITILMPPWANMSPAGYQKFTDVTGIKVKGNFIDFDSVHNKIVTAMAAGVPPADVIEVDSLWFGQFAAAGWLTPLEPYVKPSVVHTAGAYKVFQYKGQQDAMPYSDDFRWIAANMTDLKKAGISKPPVTWDQLRQDAIMVKQKGILTYPVGLPLEVNSETVEPWASLVKMSGGQILDGNDKPVFTSPSSLGYKALAYLRSLYAAGLVNPGSTNKTGDQVQADVGAGLAAFDMRNVENDPYSNPKASKVAKDKDQFARFTLGGSGPVQTVYGLPEGMGIPSNAKDKAAAAMFINWYNEPAQQIYQSSPNSAGGGGVMPAQTAAIHSLTTSGQLAAGNQIAVLTPHVVPLFENGAPSWYPQFANDAAATIQAVVLGHESVGSGLDKLAQETTALQSGS